MKDHTELYEKFVKECGKFHLLIIELTQAIEKAEEGNTQIISPNPYVSQLNHLKDEIISVEHEFKSIM